MLEDAVRSAGHTPNVRREVSPRRASAVKVSLRKLVRTVTRTPEPNPETKKKEVVWFALNEGRPVFAFAGI